MARLKMHAEEVETDVTLVGHLLVGQFPQWADLPIEPIASYGTDHDIYRLGDRLAVRLPRIEVERCVPRWRCLWVVVERRTQGATSEELNAWCGLTRKVSKI